MTIGLLKGCKISFFLYFHFFVLWYYSFSLAGHFLDITFSYLFFEIICIIIVVASAAAAYPKKKHVRLSFCYFVGA